MSAINLAKFKINGTPSADANGDRGYDATPGETLVLQLEKNPPLVSLVVFDVYNPSNPSSPMCSKNALQLNFAENSQPSYTPPYATGVGTIVIPPASDIASYIIRATAIAGNGTHVYERMVVVRKNLLRVLVPSESTQYEQRGWCEALNEAIKALASGGTVVPTVTDTNTGIVSAFPTGQSRIFHSDGSTNGGSWGTLTESDLTGSITTGSLPTNLIKPGSDGQSLITVGSTVQWGLSESGGTVLTVKSVAVINLSLSGIPNPIDTDNISLIENDRLLLINQTDQRENGVWLVKSGAWVRPDFFDVGKKASGTVVATLSGLTYENVSWICSNLHLNDIVGTDNLTFKKFAGFGSGTIRLETTNQGITVTGVTTLNPESLGSPIVLGSNGIGQLVTGLNADQLDSQDGNYYRNASNLNAGSLPGAQFNDTSHGVRGSGTLVNPAHNIATITTPGFVASLKELWLDDYGAVGDGVTDDANAIDNWLEDLVSSNLVGRMSAKIYATSRCHVFKGVRIKGVKHTLGGRSVFFALGSYQTRYATGNHWALGQIVQRSEIENVVFDCGISKQPGFQSDQRTLHGVIIAGVEYGSMSPAKSNLSISTFNTISHGLLIAQMQFKSVASGPYQEFTTSVGNNDQCVFGSCEFSKCGRVYYSDAVATPNGIADLDRPYGKINSMAVPSELITGGACSTSTTGSVTTITFTNCNVNPSMAQMDDANVVILEPGSDILIKSSDSTWVRRIVLSVGTNSCTVYDVGSRGLSGSTYRYQTFNTTLRDINDIDFAVLTGCAIHQEASADNNINTWNGFIQATYCAQGVMFAGFYGDVVNGALHTFGCGEVGLILGAGSTHHAPNIKLLYVESSDIEVSFRGSVVGATIHSCVPYVIASVTEYTNPGAVRGLRTGTTGSDPYGGWSSQVPSYNLGNSGLGPYTIRGYGGFNSIQVNESGSGGYVLTNAGTSQHLASTVCRLTSYPSGTYNFTGTPVLQLTNDRLYIFHNSSTSTIFVFPDESTVPNSGFINKGGVDRTLNVGETAAWLCIDGKYREIF